MNKQEKYARWQHKEWYTVRRLLGCQWAMFYMLIGPRENGKSYSVMEYFVKSWKERHIPFNWIRLSDESLQRMLANNGEKFVDKDLVRKYDLHLTTKGTDLYDGDECMCRGFALSMMSKDKGVALFDKDFLNDPNMYYHLGIDEFNREKQEKKTFNIVYNLVNELENILRSSKERVRIFFMANLLEEGSDILSGCFGFVPLEYGTYKLKSKRCVIDYIEPNEAYRARRRGTVADLLAPDESTFTNNIEHNFELVYKGRLHQPQYILAFGKKASQKYTIWDNNIVAPYKGEKVEQLALVPYIDIKYNKKNLDAVNQRFSARGYKFVSLITQTNFKGQLELLKPKG